MFRILDRLILRERMIQERNFVKDSMVAGVGRDNAEMRAVVVRKIEYDDKEIYLMILNK
jgi:hypothetical protein